MVTSWRMNDWPSIKSLFSNRLKLNHTVFYHNGSNSCFDLTGNFNRYRHVDVFIVYNSASVEICFEYDERHEKGKISQKLSKVRLVYVTGQLFFGSQEQLVNKVQSIEGASHIVLSIRGVLQLTTAQCSPLEQLHKDLAQRDNYICGSA